MKIKFWSGRLGNSIQQLTNALYFCESHQLNFESNSYGYVDGKSVGGVRQNGDAEIISPILITDRNPSTNPGIFFHHTGRRQDHNVDDHIKLEQSRRRYCMDYILPNSCFVNKPIKSLNDDHLVIHIRAGDIMRLNNPTKIGHIYHSYKPNPIHVYTQVIPKFSHVTIVTNDVNNFIVRKLIDMYNHIQIQSSSLVEDFSTLLAARHLMSSGVGTFPVAAALMSKNIVKYYHTNLYLPEHMSHESIFHADRTEIPIPDTYLSEGWRNNEQDREEILNSKFI